MLLRGRQGCCVVHRVSPFVTLLYACQTLSPVDTSVQPVACAQCGVGPLLENSAMVQHYDEIGLGKGQQAVREHDDRALLGVGLRRAKELPQTTDNFCFGVQIEGRERIVQDE